jgi:hypothetical protein
VNTAATNISSSVVPRTLYVFVVALVAAMMTQIIHEATHALAMVVVGTGVDRMQLYAVLGNPVTDTTAGLIIAGGAAIVNILIGLVAVLFYYQTKATFYARLLWMYLTAYMLMAGFGYLFVDALFYNPQATFFPDWQYVIHTLGGGWEVRIPILIVGIVGLLGVFFWLPPAALRFVSDPTDKATRQREMLRLTLLPYLLVNVIFTVLGVTHPLGAQAIGLIIFPYWFGYIALFWAYFIGGMWTDVKTRFADASLLKSATLPLWMIGLAAMWAVIGILMVIGLDF